MKKTYAVKDTSSPETLEGRLLERMRNSKNMLVIVSPLTNKDHGLLNWEIEQAVEKYGLPIIVAYAGLNCMNSCILETYKAWLPSKLLEYVNNNIAKIAHIPFVQPIIGRAINFYSVVDGSMPQTSRDIFK